MSWTEPSERTHRGIEVTSRSAKLGRLVRDILEAIVLAVVLFFMLQTVVQNTVVEGSSMHPNFVDQEHLLVNKLAYRFGEPARGDVVVFRSEGSDAKDFIKRVIALPGETVAIRQGRVLIDGEALDEPWLPRYDNSDFPAYEVPWGRYFVLGDNRANSNDSRVFGTRYGTIGIDDHAIPESLMVGKVWLSVWPVSTWGVVRADAPAPFQQSRRKQ